MSDIVDGLRGRADRYRQLWGNAAYYTEGDALFDEKAAARIEKLEDENASLASWQCEFTDGKTGLVYGQGGSTFCIMAKRMQKLEAALREAADELDAYYRAEYPGDHPYNQKKLAAAMASNPARAALEERT